MSINIVETLEERRDFIKRWNNHPSIVIPIWCDLEKHYVNNELSFLFVRNGEDYIIPFNHVDCLPININLNESNEEKWVWGKKGLIQSNIPMQNIHDIHSHLYFNENRQEELDFYEIDIYNHYRKANIREEVGKVIPIMKWVEFLKPFVDKIETDFKSTWVDEELIPILSDVERIGLNVNVDRFIEKWPNSIKHLDKGIVYTEYNPYIITSRPSNRHGGINYGALNKHDGTREIIIPRNGHIFLQFDYDAYHPRIIGKLIKYDLPDTSVHQWLAEQYGVDYDESKKLTFQLLYGGIPEEFREIEFYDKTYVFIEELGREADKNGYIQTPKGRKIYVDWVEDPNPQKLFNYLLQATETEFNISVLNRLKTNGYTLPLLYTYDSFLFEYGVEEGTDRAKELKQELEHFGFPVKASWGTDYSKV